MCPHCEHGSTIPCNNCFSFCIPINAPDDIRHAIEERACHLIAAWKAHDLVNELIRQHKDKTFLADGI